MMMMHGTDGEKKRANEEIRWSSILNFLMWLRYSDNSIMTRNTSGVFQLQT